MAWNCQLVNPKNLHPAKSFHAYDLHQAATEWSLADPIILHSADDIRSNHRWETRDIKPFKHHVQNLLKIVNHLPITLLADDVGLGKTISAGWSSRISMNASEPAGSWCYARPRLENIQPGQFTMFIVDEAHKNRVVCGKVRSMPGMKVRHVGMMMQAHPPRKILGYVVIGQRLSGYWNLHTRLKIK
jgi:hypothetical protein